MKGILFGGLVFIGALIGGTVYVVFDQAGAHYHAAVDSCHAAGGAWLASGERSYSGQCLRTPSTPPWPGTPAGHAGAPVTPPGRSGP